MIKAPKEISSKEALEQHLKADCKTHILPEKIFFDKKCSVQGCNDVDSRIGSVQCEGCSGDYCLKHRHPSTHNCESLFANEKKKQERKLTAQEKVAKTLKLPENVIKPTTKKTLSKTKTGGIVELMKIKSQAKGDSSVPLNSRIFLYAKYPQASSMVSMPVYFDKRITVGRALDNLAKTCKVTNKNSTISAKDPERLYLYKCPEMTCLDNSTSLENALQNLDTILLERHSVITSLEE